MTNHEQAVALAARPYQVVTQRDYGQDRYRLFVSFHPEMPTCVAQGESVEEARTLLDEVRVEYIEHLLRFGLPVPEPAVFHFGPPPPPVVEIPLTINEYSGLPEAPDVRAVSLAAPA